MPRLPFTSPFEFNSDTVNVSPTGIGSAESEGTPRIDYLLAPTSITSTEAFGVPTIVIFANPVSIPSSYSMGVALAGIFASVTAIPTAESFGVPTVSTIPFGAVNGTHALMVIATHNGDVGARHADIAVDSGEMHTASVSVRSVDHTRDSILRFRWYRSDGSLISTTDSAHMATQLLDWGRISLHDEAPDGATVLRWDVMFLSALTNERFLVDAAMVEPTEFLNDYFDANLTPGDDYVWAGATNESVSRYFPRRVLRLNRVGAVLGDYTPPGVDFAVLTSGDNPDKVKVISVGSIDTAEAFGVPTLVH